MSVLFCLSYLLVLTFFSYSLVISFFPGKSESMPVHENPQMTWICLLLLEAVLIVKIFYVESVVDIFPWDETRYLSPGLHAHSPGQLPYGVWAPLYSAWYSVLSRLHSDPMDLYYLNYKLILLCLPLILFVLLKRIKTPSAVSLILCLFYIYFMETESFTLVGFFASAILGLGLLCIKDTQEKGIYYGLIALCALAMSYARPEYTLVFVLTLMLALFFARQMKHVVLLVVCAGIFYFFIKIWGFPLNPSRAWMAFGQHTLLHDPNYSAIAWREYLELHFKGCEGLSDAVFLYPRLFWAHCLNNLNGTFWLSIESVDATTSKIFSGIWIWPAVVLTEVFNLLVFLRISLDILGNKFPGRIRIIFLLFAAAVWVSSIAIFPMPHYYTTYRFLWLMLAGFCLGKTLSSQAKLKLVAILALFLALGSIAWERDASSRSMTYTQTPNASLIKTLQSMKASGSVNLLQVHGSFGEYLPSHFCAIFLPERKFSWADFIREKKIDMMIVSDPLFRGQLVSDPEIMEKFLAKPQDYGYHKVKIPNNPYYLLISDKRKDIV